MNSEEFEAMDGAADERALSAGLRALALRDQAAAAPARLETALRSAFRAHSALPAGRPNRRWIRWALPIAACLLAVLGATLSWRPKPVPEPRPQRPKIEVPLMAGNIRPQRPAPPVHKEAEAASFVALSYADGSYPMESGQVVRVRVPRAALASLGFPVNEELLAESVNADVVFGEDGIARAIRFVR